MKDIAIVVVAGGHIFVGQIDRNTEATTLSPCRQFRRLGTTDLVGGLINGPTHQTDLMAPIGYLRIPAGQVRFEAQVDADKWAHVLGGAK